MSLRRRFRQHMRWSLCAHLHLPIIVWCYHHSSGPSERRVKCSGEAPCVNCQKSGIECVFRRRLKPGLKPGSGEAMQARITALQEELKLLKESLGTRMEALEGWMDTLTAFPSAATMTAGAAATPPALSSAHPNNFTSANHSGSPCECP